MNNMYDPTSPIRDRRMTDRQATRSERPEGMVARKEKAESVDESDRNKFEKVFSREDKLTKKKSAEELASTTKSKKKSPFKRPPKSKDYVPSSHEQAMRQQISEQENEEMVYVAAEGSSSSQMHSPLGQTDPLAINPTTNGAGQSTSVRAAELQEIIDQIVSKLYTVQKKGSSDTLMTLRHPPILQGAVLKLSAYANAPKEFNLSFSGLTQGGKNLVDENQALLMRGLEKQGFVVHIVVTSTMEDSQVGSSENARQTADDQQEKGREEQEQEPQENE